MFIVRSFLGLLCFFIGSSHTLRCTVKCNYRLNITTSFSIPDSCNETSSAGQCQVDIKVQHDTEDYTVDFTSESSDYIMNDRLSMIFRFDSNSLSYSSKHECKNKDDCAREYAIEHAPEILRQPILDYRSIGAELKPLLLAGPSTDNSDLICFDTNENVRQCSNAKIAGECQVSDRLIEKKKLTRACDQEKYGLKKYISIYDSGDYAKFEIQCNRSLCNGPMTTDAVKEIMLKYNVTKTLSGRLKNNAEELVLSLLSITMSLLFISDFPFFLTVKMIV